ncbi:G patch domain-containing protein 11 [Chironomus tepperi]|uniref:G patch domain-containing protein 11 n=1 Tax=Chironomus tepperi TaxID=113505 RepID=UPI00391F2598
MSSDEEDYMSDAFLAKLEDVKPSLVTNNSIKRRNEIELRQQKEKQKYKPMHVVQKEKLKEGLNKALTSDNKGFALLSKMGYKEGTSLGKTQQAIKEPIKIKVPTEGRLGLGTETVIKEYRERELTSLKRKINANDMSTEEYRKQMREISDKKQVSFDLHKLQRTCRLLDMDSRVNAPIHAWFWPETKTEEDTKEKEDEETESTELSDIEKLEMLRKFLRNSYFYCEFCSEHYKDANDMKSNCPGPNKDDH